MQIKVSGLIGVTFALMLAACGGDATLGVGGPNDPPDDGQSPDLVGARIGSLVNGVFTEGQLLVGTTSLSAGGQASVRVDVVNAAGQRLSNVPLTATFQSECASATPGQSRFEPATVESSAGRFDTTYVAQGCRGNDVLTARVDLGGQIRTASAVIDVAPPELGGIEFIFAESTIIGLIGSPIATQAEIRFRVVDQTGGVVANQPVVFTLSTTVGGLSLTPTTADTDSQGIVRTTVRAGSIPTAVRVTARVTLPSGQQISTQSEQLAVSTGIPDQDSVSLSFNRLAVDGTCDGEPVTVNLRLADRFNNPVPAGTAVNFRTSGGAINSTCFTGEPNGDPLTESGVCSVLLTAREPRPANGRVAILATTLGEESFVDINGNGFRDPGETWGDLPEPFLDVNENGQHDLGEVFIDTDSSQSYSPANGVFDGYVCDAPGQNCRTQLVHVRANGTVVFSLARSGVFVGCLNAPGQQCPFLPGVVVPGQSLNLSFSIEDINGQVPPTGTTYSLAATTGTVVAPTTVGPFNTSAPGPSVVSFRYQAPAQPSQNPATQLLTLTVNLPASECAGPAAFSAVVGEFIF